ncbi:spermatogenesis-associated protein 6-like [Rhincodon typus]|uniref:spermatogenesis-associated protein 6-like n=1 Tax=Rhincodon typus TaxID=259920 RepID=UPI0020303EA1|nr:spermatogenesis-associated protein 6-like [Rhincodon typus]
MPQKFLKCVIQLEIHAVTCPGVMLPRKDELYINIYMLGQYWKTKCFMPIFPLLIHESLQFEKVFGKDVVDPADVAAFLECDTTKFELMQYSPSGITTKYLIAPKLEFSTTTTITECCPRSPKKISSSLCLSESGRKENQFRRPRCAKSFNLIGKSCSEKKSEKERKKPAVAARSRSLSPYCRKCLLELCLDDGQHSSPRKSDSFGRTFTNRSCDRNTCEKKHSSSLSCSSFDRSAKSRPRTASPSICHNDSYRSRYDITKNFDAREPISWDELSSEAEELISFPLNSTTRDNPSDLCSSSVCSRRKPPCQTNRFYFDPVSHPAWDRIHERVQNLLASIDAQERASARNINFTCPPCS